MYNNSKCISSDSLLSALKKTLKDDGIMIKKLCVLKPSLKGSHFSSEVEELEVTYVTTQKTENTIHLFAKYQSENTTHTDRLNSINATLKEIRFYDTLIPAMKEFCEKESTTHIPLRFPKCFYTKYDKIKDVIVLENLSKLGFRLNPFTIERQDFAHSKLVMEALANFHAITFTMIRKTGYPNLAQCPFLEDVMFGDAGKAAFEKSLQKAFGYVLKCLEGDSQHHDTLTKLGRIREKLLDIGSALVKDAGPFQVVCRGDCHSNNMVFRYDQDGMPVEVIMLDMQTIYVSSLTTDLSQFLISSTTVQFRKENLIKMLSYYYETFTSSLGYFGIRDCGFSFEEMLEDYRHRCAFNIAFLPLFIGFPLMQETDLKDVGETEDIVRDMSDLVGKIVADPKMGKIFKDDFVAIYKELKYSLDNVDVEY